MSYSVVPIHHTFNGCFAIERCESYNFRILFCIQLMHKCAPYCNQSAHLKTTSSQSIHIFSSKKEAEIHFARTNRQLRTRRRQQLLGEHRASVRGHNLMLKFYSYIWNGVKRNVRNQMHDIIWARIPFRSSRIAFAKCLIHFVYYI